MIDLHRLLTLLGGVGRAAYLALTWLAVLAVETGSDVDCGAAVTFQSDDVKIAAERALCV